VYKRQPEIQKLQTRLREQEARLERLAQERLIKENKNSALETFRQEENLICYYRTLLIKLEDIFISCKAVHGGFTEGRRGRLGAVSQAINLLGEMVPLPGANLVTNLAAFGLEEIAETRLHNMANHISRLVTLQELEIVAEYTARKLTEWYAPLLRELADTNTFVQARIEMNQTRIGQFRLLMQNIRKRTGRALLRTEPYLPAQQVAEFAILWLLDALCACEIQWTPNLDLGAEFVRIVTTHQNAGGLVQNFRKGLQDRLGLGTVPTRSGQNWTVENIYTASGIQTQCGERWRAKEAIPYGYCNGDRNTAQARGLIYEGIITEHHENNNDNRGRINEEIRRCLNSNELRNLEHLLTETEYLDLSGLDLRNAMQNFATALRTNATIKTINLSNCNLDARCLHCLIEALRNVRVLKSLDLSNNKNLSFQSQNDVMMLLSISTLEKINLTNTGLNKIGRRSRDSLHIITALELDQTRHIIFLGDTETNRRISSSHKIAIRALLNRNVAARLSETQDVPTPDASRQVEPIPQGLGENIQQKRKESAFQNEFHTQEEDVQPTSVKLERPIPPPKPTYIQTGSQSSPHQPHTICTEIQRQEFEQRQQTTHTTPQGFFQPVGVSSTDTGVLTFEQAIQEDDVPTIILLIDRGFNPMIKFSNGDTELHKAVRANSQQVLKYLVNEYIQRGSRSRLEYKNDEGQTALNIAREQGKSDMINFLTTALQTSQQQFPHLY